MGWKRPFSPCRQGVNLLNTIPMEIYGVCITYTCLQSFTEFEPGPQVPWKPLSPGKGCVIFYACCFRFSEVTNVACLLLLCGCCTSHNCLLRIVWQRQKAQDCGFLLFICEAILCNPFREMTKDLSPTSSAWHSLPYFCLSKCHGGEAKCSILLAGS